MAEIVAGDLYTNQKYILFYKNNNNVYSPKSQPTPLRNVSILLSDDVIRIGNEHKCGCQRKFRAQSETRFMTWRQVLDTTVAADAPVAWETLLGFWVWTDKLGLWCMYTITTWNILLLQPQALPQTRLVKI